MTDGQFLQRTSSNFFEAIHGSSPVHVPTRYPVPGLVQCIGLRLKLTSKACSTIVAISIRIIMVAIISAQGVPTCEDRSQPRSLPP